jgi:serine/threonine protein kinase
VQSEGTLYLVFEFLQKDLKKYMDSVPNTLDPMLVKVSASCTGAIFPGAFNPHHDAFSQSYLYQMLRGLHFCHARGVMHRSVAPLPRPNPVPPDL